MSCTFGDFLQTLEDHSLKVKDLFAHTARLRPEPGVHELLGLAGAEEDRTLTALQRFHAAHRHDVLASIWIQFPLFTETVEVEHALGNALRTAVDVTELRRVIVEHRRALEARLRAAAEGSAAPRLDAVLNDLARLMLRSSAECAITGDLV